MPRSPLKQFHCTFKMSPVRHNAKNTITQIFLACGKFYCQDLKARLYYHCHVTTGHYDVTALALLTKVKKTPTEPIK